MTTIRFYYDVVCPYAYLASTLIDSFAAEQGWTVSWEPVLLGGLLRHHGAPDDPNRAVCAARARMTRADIVRSADFYGAPMTFPAAHPRRTLEAMRLIVAAPPQLRRELSAALFAAYWADERDLTKDEVLDEIATRTGVDPDCRRAAQVKDELRARTAAAAQLGVFGVPTFVAGDRLVWGHDRLPILAHALGVTVPPVSAPRRVSASPSRGPMTVEFFHDFASPFSYLAATQIARICQAAGARLVYSPILLGALFRSIGTADVPLFTMHEAKQRYIRQDLEDWAAYWNVGFRFPSSFPLRTVLPLRVAVAEPKLTDAIYRAAWVEDRPIDRPEVLCQVVSEAGFPGSQLLEHAGRDDIKQALRRNTDAAVAAGVCGIPSFRVCDGAGQSQLLWGQDRLGMLAAML